MSFSANINNKFNAIGLSINDDQVEWFKNYFELLKSWNENMNLTGITDEEGVIVKHFCDSLTMFKSDISFENKSVIDVGTGAGFPGMPMKMYEPTIELTLLDSLNKRINFLQAVGESAGLSDIDYIHGRAEDFGRDLEYREQYDFAVSRAVADLAVLLEYCLPFVKVGGYFLALKGPKGYDEIDNAKNALEILGGQVEEVLSYDLPNTDIKHNIILIKKVSSCPEKYPRRAGKPTKKPL